LGQSKCGVPISKMNQIGPIPITLNFFTNKDKITTSNVLFIYLFILIHFANLTHHVYFDPIILIYIFQH